MEVEAPLVSCSKRWQSDHTYHHPHRLNELATKSEKCNKKHRLVCANVRHPPSETRVDVLLWTFRSEGIHDRADRLAGKAAVVNGMRLGMSEVFRSWRHYLQEQSQDTTPATAWRESHRQSDEHWSCLKTTLGKRLWETGWSAYGLCRADTTLNWASC